MKKLLFILLLLSVQLSWAQSSVSYKYEGNKIVKTAGNDTALDRDANIVLEKATFGKTKLTTNKNSEFKRENSIYYVKVDTLSIDLDGNYIIHIDSNVLHFGRTHQTFSGDDIYLRINKNETPAHIHLKSLVSNNTRHADSRGQTSIIPDQSIYYDALVLKERTTLEGDNKKTVLEVLKKYGVTSNNINDIPFLKDMFGYAFSSNSMGDTSGHPQALFANPANLLGSAANMNVTNFADGLAKFLVERGKEELNVAFFDKLKDFLKDYPEATTLFPTTISFIGDINSYQYASMLPTLRAAFHKDLNAMGDNLLKLRDLEETCCGTGDKHADEQCRTRIKNLAKFLNTDPKGRALVASVILTNGIIKGETVAAAITDAATDKCATDYNDNLSNLLFFTDLISQSLLSKDSGRVWVTRDEIYALVQNETFLKCYLGLLCAKDQQDNVGHKISFVIPGDTIKLLNVMNKLDAAWKVTANAKEVINFKKALRDIGYKAADVSAVARSISNSSEQNNNDDLLLYANYASTVSSFIKAVVQILPADSLLDMKLAKLKADAAVATSVIDNAVSCAYDIKSKNYGSLVMHVAVLLDTAFRNSDNNKNAEKFKSAFIKYGTFMASVVEANNSDEVKKAIEAAVLPVGSASIKRETPWNISLNAYIGAFGGKEQQFDGTWVKGAMIGVTAPVGIAFSKGSIKCNPKHGGKSFTAFISVINVGTLASYRLKNDTAALASEVKLKDIIAPGLSLYWGLGKVPLSFGLGAELSPQPNTLGDQQIYYMRYTASLVVDIPLFNLYTKTK